MEINIIDQLPRRPLCVAIFPTSVPESGNMARELSIPALRDIDFNEDINNSARYYVNSLAQNIIVSPLAKKTEHHLQIALQRCVRLILSTQMEEVVFRVDNLEFGQLLTIISRSLNALSYNFDKFKSKAKVKRALQRVQVYTGRTNTPLAQVDLRDQNMIGLGIDFARDLANTPPNVCTPDWLATSVQQLGREANNITVEVLDDIAIRGEKMNALLAVAGGSSNAARLLVLNYRGMTSNRRPIVLIGKGITFDTGGISIKPAAKMDEMKYDMCGAAAVIATMKVLDSLQVPLNVVAVVPCAENMPSGTAYRPGDIVTTKSGKTVEVLNTDAEGRLILADAITFSERYNPRQIIDVATLTGACIVALGHHLSAVYSNDDKLADALIDASKLSMDEIWRMPLGAKYQRQLKSEFADLANIGGPAGGSITAACFLENFIPANTSWAHLDIAGTAWVSAGGSVSKGATGRPTALLSQYLISLSRSL